MRQPLTKKGKTVFVLILILAFVLRLAWIFNVPNTPVSDFLAYYDLSKNLLSGAPNFWKSYVGLGYPFMLSVVFALFKNNSPIVAYILNAVFATANVALIFVLCRKIFRDNAIPFVIMLFFALFPHYIAYTNMVATESAFAFVLLLTIITHLSDFKHKLCKFALLGLFIGVGATIKPYFVAYLAIVLLIEIAKRPSIADTLKRVLVAVGICILAIAPLAIFNYFEFHMFMPLSYNGGYVLYLNNNPENTSGHYMDIETEITPPQRLVDNLRGIDVEYGRISPYAEKFYRQEAVDFIAKNPAQFAKLGYLRVLGTFSGDVWDITSWSLKEVVDIVGYEKFIAKTEWVWNCLMFLCGVINLVGIIGALCICGYTLVSFARKKPLPNIGVVALSLAIWMFVAIYFVFEGQPRYAYPVYFMNVIVIAYLCSCAVAKVRRRFCEANVKTDTR